MKISKKKITEARLREAINRLIEGKPEKVKPSGKITLNRINNEAGLSASYIHKFPDGGVLGRYRLCGINRRRYRPVIVKKKLIDSKTKFLIKLTYKTAFFCLYFRD